ncbi:MAG: DNA-3-methyladenine glycosylase [Oscillospiraceae bacterium]|nr:DNA-3-methyladenine glycosylase [Oscillospiraceae bacterium]
MEQLTREFFSRDTVTVARDLLGRHLVRVYRGRVLSGRITETEAYVGRCDRACHAYGYRRTARTETLFARPGTAYIYMIYGMYHCLNLVTEEEGEPAAVLIRSLEPLSGEETMAGLRYQRPFKELTAARRKNLLNGPGKICQALALDRSLDGLDLTGSELYVLTGDPGGREILSGPRIGVDYAGEDAALPWRFRYAPV